ncbi:MAG: hypothetical protein OWU32_03295 [Firmicutes bacterium]|nr:hypothetical protein [Bacillota bacterium]
MRFEEMNKATIGQVAPYCDTVVLSCGSLRVTPAHLPFGSSWYVVRRLRDGLESALGGRILTMPTLMLADPAREDGVFCVDAPGLAEAFCSALTALSTLIRVRHVVLIADREDAPRALQTAVKDWARGRTGIKDVQTGLPDTVHDRMSAFTPNDPSVIEFVWWRDGLGRETTYVPGGEIESSILLSVADRLVDLSGQDAATHEATFATGAHGEILLRRMDGELRSRLTGAWTAVQPS